MVNDFRRRDDTQLLTKLKRDQTLDSFAKILNNDNMNNLITLRDPGPIGRQINDFLVSQYFYSYYEIYTPMADPRLSSEDGIVSHYLRRINAALEKENNQHRKEATFTLNAPPVDTEKLKITEAPRPMLTHLSYNRVGGQFKPNRLSPKEIDKFLAKLKTSVIHSAANIAHFISLQKKDKE